MQCIVYNFIAASCWLESMPLIIQMWSILCGFWNRTFFLFYYWKVKWGWLTQLIKFPCMLSLSFHGRVNEQLTVTLRQVIRLKK